MCTIFIIVSGMSSPDLQQSYPSWNICSGTSFYLQEGKWITSIIASRSIATRAETPVATVLQTRTPTQTPTSDMCFVLCFCAVGVCFFVCVLVPCVFLWLLCLLWIFLSCVSCAFWGFVCLLCLAPFLCLYALCGCLCHCVVFVIVVFINKHQ